MPLILFRSEHPDGGEPIEGPEKVIRQEPLNLPTGFVWCTCNIDNDKEVSSVQKWIIPCYLFSAESLKL